MTFRPWPFLSPLVSQRTEDEIDDNASSDSPYCECDLEPTLQEQDSRKCLSCGKQLIS